MSETSGLESPLPTAVPLVELSREEQVTRFSEMAFDLLDSRDDNLPGRASFMRPTDVVSVTRRIPGIVTVTSRVLELPGDWELVERQKKILGRPAKVTHSLVDTSGRRAPRGYDWVVGTSWIRQQSFVSSELQAPSGVIFRGTDWEHTRLASWSPGKINEILSGQGDSV